MIDARNQQFVTDNPGGSIRQIATRTGIPAYTVWHVLMTRLGYVWRKGQLVPHTLSEAQCMGKFQRTQVLLITLRRAESTVWGFSSTSDESWFLYYTSRRKLWILPIRTPLKWRDS
jgi:hypothetical protein